MPQAYPKKKKTEITHLPNTQKMVGKKMTGIRKSAKHQTVFF
jgi:hypothetical protein